MGNATGFLQIKRAKTPERTIQERIGDWNDVTLPESPGESGEQAARCMDCGIPFCHSGCPLGNLIPDWNDLVYRSRWRDASDRLHATNNFPEITGRLCPAPCEASCVLAINDDAVAIKSIERAIADRAFEEGWVRSRRPAMRTGRSVAVVGSGPAGLAAADQLNTAGHLVTVFERADRIGGLLRYGIPEFKLEKRILNRRLALLEDAGIIFRAGVAIGADIPMTELRKQFDAVVLCCGAGAPRDLRIPGRDLDGIEFAVDYLTRQNRACEGEAISPEQLGSAQDRQVVIIGGGDTGADCLGTAIRQKARSVRQFELLPRPSASRGPENPWPEWPRIFRTSAAHAEGGDRLFSVSTERFIGDERGRVRALEGVAVEPVNDGAGLRFEPVRGSEFTLPTDLVLIATGFGGPEQSVVSQLGVRTTERGTVWRDDNWMTSQEGVFTAGDMQRGQSLIVWAIADGRQAARAVDQYLAGAAVLRAAAS
jgi:glutamate synthase (NADPH/NADH) small chain